MKRIKLYAYFADNFGDDLMVDILLKRFSECNFYNNQFISLKNSLYNNKNFVSKEQLYQHYGRINHFVNIITLKKIGNILFDKIFQKYEDSCKCAVYIGGSLFMQDSLDDTQTRIEKELERIKSLPMHVIGANFGPYYTEDFLGGV